MNTNPPTIESYELPLPHNLCSHRKKDLASFNTCKLAHQALTLDNTIGKVIGMKQQ